MSALRQPSRPNRGMVIALLLVLLTAAALRLRGIHWPRYHPDETVIAIWLAHGGPDRAYAGGFFTLAHPFRWCWETGLSLRHRFDQFRGLTDSPSPPRPDFVLLARYFNVVLSALSCLLLFLAGQHLSGSPVYGLFSAALLALSQYHVEHSHYAETDIAMVFALSLSLAAWIAAIARSRQLWFALAALAGGFAAGTKFTLFSLWPAYLIFPIIGKSARVFSNDWKTRGFGVFWTAALLLIGFTLATPAVTDWREFWESAVHEGSRVARETALNMGPLAGNRIVRWTARLYDFARWSCSLGTAWLVLWAISLPCFLAPSARRYAMPLIVAPLLFTAYWIFLSPWVRTQEFMVFLPFAAVTAPWAAQYLWASQTTTLRAMAWVACLAALIQTGVRAARVSSIFGWTDTRISATRWLQASAPDALYAKEKYADVLTRNGAPTPIRTVLRYKIPQLHEKGFDYVFRNGAEGDRGTVHPVTGRRYPEFDERYREFLSHSQLLRVFAPLPPGDTFTTFNSIRVELYGLRRFATWPTIRAPLPQPARISRGERPIVFPVGRQLGADTAMEVTRDGVICALGGPDEASGPVYAVLYTRERPAEVMLEGLGTRHRVRLNPYDAVAVPLVRPSWKPRLSHFEPISARARPQKNIYRIPCYLRIAFTRAEARRILRDLGMPISDARSIGPESESSLTHIQRLEELANTSPQMFGVGEVSAWYYDQFARLCETNGLSWARMEAEEDGERPVRISFPMVRPPFASRLEFELRVNPDDSRSTNRVEVELADPRTSTILLCTNLVPRELERLSLNLAPGSMTDLELLFYSDQPVQLDLGKAELTWNIKDVLQNEIEQARLAHAEWLAREGRTHASWSYLAGLRTLHSPIARLRAARLRFETAPEDDRNLKLSAAHDLLAFAPNHVEARRILSESGIPAHEQTPDESNGPSGKGFRFSRFVIVRGGTLAEDSSQISFTVDIQQDAPPPLAIRLFERRRGRWKPLNKATIAQGRSMLASGERFLVHVPVKGSVSTNRLGFGVETDVRWHPGRLPVQGYSDGVVPLQKLLR